MASQTTSKTPAKPHSKVQTYVNRQLDRTRRQVKSTDLITRLIVGVLLVLAMLQIFAIIDAWVWSFNPAARWLCFLSLLGAIAAYGVLAVAPLFMRKIHPDYAAKMIEDERPSFKNSLLNYVSLRKQPARTHTAIMDAVSKQAALDLQTVPDDAAVDQSSIIRSGTILLGLIGFAVVYWLVSPKDPLQSFSRVLLPSIKQSAPSVVQVLDVSPGDHEIFFGDSLEVAATIKGSFNPEDVKLVYSTTDGQLVDQEVAMLPETDANRRFTALLPPDQSGIQQSLIYRVVARDGQSPDYDIVVKPNPSISIDALTITPPVYTGLPVETLGGQENIEAPEGSNVRVEALANLPIKLAYMELLKRKNGGDQQGDDFRIVETVKMLVDSQNPQRAAGEFLAVLNSDRTDSKASHYRLKFLSTTDDRNQRANISPIRVIADLAPELDVLNPLKNRSKLPANETMLIEARAFDIDYGISSIQLNMDNKGSSVFPVKSLQLRSEQGKQRVKGRFLFKPEEHFLRSGDIVVFALTANDNRVSHLSGMLDPNSVQSRQYQVEITAAVENPKAPPEPGQQEKKKDQSGDQQEPSDEQRKSEQGANQDGGDGDGQEFESDQSKDGESSERESSEQKESESGSSGSQSGDQSEEGESSDSASGGSESDRGSESGESGDGQESSNESRESSQMSESGGSESDSSESDSREGGGQEQTDTESSGSNQKPSDSGSSDQEGSSSSGNQTGDGGESRGEKPQPQSGESKNRESNSGEGSDRQGDESGESGAGDQADGESGGQGGNAQQQEGEERKPLGENATDGERMSRLEEMMKEEQAKNGEGQNDEAQNSERQSSDDADAAKQNTGSGKDPEQNDPRESQGTGSMQEDNAKAAEEGAENNAQKGDGSSSSSQGNQDGTAKGSSGSKTGEQSNEGASSDDSDKGQSNETGGKEAGESKTESGNENSTQSKDGEGAAGKSEEGGAQPSDQAGENGGNQKSQKGDGQPSEQAGQPGQESGQPGERGDKASEEAGGKSGDKAGQEPQEGGKPGEQGEGGEPGQKGAGEEAGSGGAESGEAGKAGQGGQGGQGESGEAQGGAAGDGGESTEQGDNVGSGQGGGRQHNMIKEKENLEHSRKATDMVLNRLEEQRYDPDPELLEELNWSKDDLNQFLDRWNEMKQKAETGTDPAAKRRYEQAIKSLGLSPDSGQRKVKGVSDEKTGFKTDSAVNRPPPRIAPAFKAYLRDRNRAAQE